MDPPGSPSDSCGAGPQEGEAVALRYNEGGQCDVPALPSRTQYLQATAGVGHTVLLRSNGEAVAFDTNEGGRNGVARVFIAWDFNMLKS